MKINLNQPFTTDDVKALLASTDDSVHRQLRVDANGTAFISDVVGNIDKEGLAFVSDTLSAGSGYVGAEAANDSKWVARVEKALRENWPNPTSDFIDLT